MTFRVRRPHFIAFTLLGCATVLSTGCSRPPAETDAHAGHESSSATSGTSATTARTAASGAIPASATIVADRLAKSPRHGEYAMIRTGPSDSVRAWVVYPERSNKAPVVVVVHERREEVLRDKAVVTRRREDRIEADDVDFEPPQQRAAAPRLRFVSR